ncbi:DMT family transporter [Clostridium baratii]|uniref:DMT family transporter n=1 Tax=Clostridium baratii TaxID=1561 RepID=UPI0030CFFD9A
MNFNITKIESNKSSGTFNAVMSAIMWGADTVLIGLVIVLVSSLNMKNAVFLAPFVSAFLHDFCSAIWLTIYLFIKRELKKVKISLKTKSAKFVILGGVLGGPIGMAGYLLAIQNLGASYTAAISSIYPAVGAIMAKIILKEKMNKRGWIGLILSILGITIMSYSKSETSVNIIGFLFLILCIVGWGSEAVVCAIGMNDDEISSNIALFLRQCTSSIIYGIVIIPLIKGVEITFNTITDNVMFLIVLTAFFGAVSYTCYYSAISKIGATKAMGINITYFVWAMIFDTIFMGNDLLIKNIFFGIIIMFGSYLVAKED